MEVRDLIAILRRGFVWVMLAGLALGLTVFAWNSTSDSIYEATSHILVSKSGGNLTARAGDISDSQRLASTYVKLVEFAPVVENTMAAVDYRGDIDSFRNAIVARTFPGTQVLAISFRDSNRDYAALVANTLAKEFIAYVGQLETDQVRQPIASLEAERIGVSAEMSRLEDEIASTSEPAQQQLLINELAEYQAIDSGLRVGLQTLKVEAAAIGANLTIAEPAAPPEDAIGPRTLSNTILATAVGLVVGFGLLVLYNYLEDTILSPDQLQDVTGRNILGSIPVMNVAKPADQVISRDVPRSPIAEAYRILRTNLEFAAIDQDMRTLLITSATPSAGKSTTAANMAVVLAQTGKKVVLIDGDLRRPTQHMLFETHNRAGLTTALVNKESDVEEYIQETTVENLSLLTSGQLPPNPSELLGSKRLGEVLDRIKQLADVIVFDVPPVLAVAEATQLAPKMDGFLMIARRKHTRQADILRACETLDRSGAKMFGLVMNGVSADSKDGYYHYYGADDAPVPTKAMPRQRRVAAWMSTIGNR